MLRTQIQDEMKQAMRDKAQLRLDALRYLWSEVKNAEIDAKVELDDQAIHAIVKREIKKRNDSIEQMKVAGRDVADEVAKVAVLGEFAMEEMGETEVGELVDQVINSGVKDFGAVMKEVMGLAGGKVDGKMVSELVKKRLNG